MAGLFFTDYPPSWEKIPPVEDPGLYWCDFSVIFNSCLVMDKPYVMLWINNSFIWQSAAPTGLQSDLFLDYRLCRAGLLLDSTNMAHII